MKSSTEARGHRAFGFSVPLCLCLSILIHVLLAIALGAYLEYAPAPDVLASLDLSSVELSFAETVEETAAVAPTPPSAAEQAAPRPPPEANPPEVKPEKPLPPEAGEFRFPEPREDARLKTEDVKVKDRERQTEDAKAASAPAVAPRQARVDAPPRPKRNIRPDYPKGARQRGEQGDVVLEIRVNAGGTVDEARVVESSGFAELDEAAVRAAKAAKFAPARSGREAVASTARLKLQFKLK